MENRNEMNAIVSLLGDVLIELQEQRKENRENNDKLINTFNSGFSKMLEKLDQIADHENRIRKIEEVVFKKGA